jgi:hypothetical protein
VLPPPPKKEVQMVIVPGVLPISLYFKQEASVASIKQIHFSITNYLLLEPFYQLSIANYLYKYLPFGLSYNQL